MISSRNTSDEPVSRQPPWPVSMGARSSATPECGAGVRAGPAATAPELVYPGAGVRSGLPSGPCPGLRGRAAGGPSGGHLGLCRWCAPGRSVGRAGSSACGALRVGCGCPSFSGPGGLGAIPGRPNARGGHLVVLIYLGFVLWAVVGSVVKLIAYQRVLMPRHEQTAQDHQLDTRAA